MQGVLCIRGPDRGHLGCGLDARLVLGEALDWLCGDVGDQVVVLVDV